MIVLTSSPPKSATTPTPTAAIVESITAKIALNDFAIKNLVRKKLPALRAIAKKTAHATKKIIAGVASLSEKPFSASIKKKNQKTAAAINKTKVMIPDKMFIAFEKV